MARRFRNRSFTQFHAFRRSSGRSLDSHRQWLIAQHGSVCAYCGVETVPSDITLDHVTPRQGKTAYDRPDNVVLACAACNAEKKDTPLLAFLLQKRSRGVFLLHYGEHLTEPLKELARKATERAMLPPADSRMDSKPIGMRHRRGGG